MPVFSQNWTYAEQYFQKNPNLNRCSRFRKWVSTTAAEMKRYLALADFPV
jgi:hypothetical protein